MNKKIVLYTPHKGQLKVHRSKARFRVVPCGRRWGKTLMGCNEVSRFSLEHNNACCAWVAPTYRQSKIAYRLIRRALKDIITYKSDSELRLEFKNGSSITFFSSDNYDALRGNGFHLIILDECADINEKAWTEVLRPTLSDTQGKALFIGTPKGRNFFFRLFMRGLDPLYPDWESFTAPTSSNPYILLSELEAAKKELPEDVYEQEYDAVFRADSAGVFRGIDRCIVGDIDPDYKPVPGHQYVAGWDAAKFNDYSVLCIIDAYTMEIVKFWRTNLIDYTLQINQIAPILADYKAICYMDVTGVGAPLAEQLKAKARVMSFRVEEYLFTNSSKKILVESLQLAIQDQRIKLKNIEVLINELRIFEYVMTAARNMTYSAPAGAHDDCAIALMLANYGASQPRGVLMWSIDDASEDTPSLERGNSNEKRYVERFPTLENIEQFKEQGTMIELEAW